MGKDTPTPEQPPVLAKYGRLLSAADAATYLGMQLSLMRRLLRKGQIAVARHPSGRLLGIYERHLDQWVESRLSQPEESATTDRARAIGVDARMAAHMPKVRVFARG